MLLAGISMSDFKILFHVQGLRRRINTENVIERTQENKRADANARRKHGDTWEAAKHGVSVVSSVEHLQRVPVLLCDKADYLDLRQGGVRKRKKRMGFGEPSSNSKVKGVCVCGEIKSKVEELKIEEEVSENNGCSEELKSTAVWRVTALAEEQQLPRPWHRAKLFLCGKQYPTTLSSHSMFHRIKDRDPW